MKTTAAFGSWKSPLSAELLTQTSIKLRDVRTQGDDTYWLELRAREGGRYVLVHRNPKGVVKDILPHPTARVPACTSMAGEASWSIKASSISRMTQIKGSTKSAATKSNR